MEPDGGEFHVDLGDPAQNFSQGQVTERRALDDAGIAGLARLAMTDVIWGPCSCNNHELLRTLFAMSVKDHGAMSCLHADEAAGSQKILRIMDYQAARPASDGQFFPSLPLGTPALMIAKVLLASRHEERRVQRPL